MSIVQEKMYMDVDDVCAILGVSKAYAYNLMREYNKELKAKQESESTMSEEVQEFVNLTITEHMGKAYSEWKLNQDKESVSEIDKKYQKLLETLSPEQEEVITEYCNAIFSSGADTEEFFYRLGC
jgi:hypothetical protein